MSRGKRGGLERARARSNDRVQQGVSHGDAFFESEGFRQSMRCSRDTYPESYITEYTSIRRKIRPPVAPPVEKASPT